MKYLGLALMLMMSLQLSAQKELPSVNIKNLSGEVVNIQDFGKNGKITVISFWATWCAPCKRELDAIAEIYEDWQADYDMELIAVSTDNARQFPKVKPMVDSKRWDYIVLSDVKQDLQRALNFQTVPMTFLIDQNGKIVYEHSGYSPGDEYELEDKIKALRKGK